MNAIRTIDPSWSLDWIIAPLPVPLLSVAIVLADPRHLPTIPRDSHDRDAPSPGKMFSRKGSLSSSSNPPRRWNRSNELKEKRRNTVRSICATNADQRVSIWGEIINGQGRKTRIFGKKFLSNESEWIYSFVKCKFRVSVFPGCTMVDDKRPCDSWSAWTSIKFPSLHLFPLPRTWPTIHLAD